MDGPIFILSMLVMLVSMLDRLLIHFDCLKHVPVLEKFN